MRCASCMAAQGKHTTPTPPPMFSNRLRPEQDMPPTAMAKTDEKTATVRWASPDTAPILGLLAVIPKQAAKVVDAHNSAASLSQSRNLKPRIPRMLPWLLAFNTASALGSLRHSIHGQLKLTMDGQLKLHVMRIEQPHEMAIVAAPLLAMQRQAVGLILPT